MIVKLFQMILLMMFTILVLGFIFMILKKKIIKSIYSDGFSEDRRRISSDIVLLISILLTLSLILNFIISPFCPLLTQNQRN